MATDHGNTVIADRESPARELGGAISGAAAAVRETARDDSAAAGRRRSAHLFRGGVSLATVGVFVVLVLGRRTALTRSLRRIGHPPWSWIVLGIALEVSSMTTFALMRRLLRVGGRSVGTGPMMATILAANTSLGALGFRCLNRSLLDGWLPERPSV
jgi:hypothetical protein